MALNTATVPTPLSNQNPEGSTYASTFSHDTTALLRKEIERVIFDKAPKQYDAMKILNMLPTKTKKADEFTYVEKVWTRQALEVSTWTHGTKTLVLAGTYATVGDLNLQTNFKFYDPNGVQYIIKTVNHSASADTSAVVIEKVNTTGSSWTPILGDFAAADVLTVAGALAADGMDEIGTGNKVQTVQRYNYFEMFQRAQVWTPLQLLNMKNNGTTDIMDYQKKENLEQLRLDIFSSMFAGGRGEAIVYKPSATGTEYETKTMHGIINMMIDGGSEHASPTWSGVQTAFEALSFSTNKKAVGGLRVIMARDEVLTEIAKSYKSEGTRYAPNDRIADLNLMEYKIGTMRFVPVNAELFSADAGVLPPVWDNRLLCLDIQNFYKCQMMGYPYIQGGETKGLLKDGLESDYTKWWVRAYTSLQANGVDGSFYMDIQN